MTDDNAYRVRCRDAFQSKCKRCGSEYAKKWRDENRERERSRSKSYYHENKEHLRKVYDRSRIIRKYGVTPEFVAKRKAAANGMCECCGKRESTAIDHCHLSGVFRGLLCNGCNTALGMMSEDVESILALAEYARKFQNQQGIK